MKISTILQKNYLRYQILLTIFLCFSSIHVQAQRSPINSLTISNAELIFFWDISPDYTKIVAGIDSDENEVLVLEANSLQTLQVFKVHERPITSIAFSPNGEWVATGDANATVIVWNINSGEILKTFRTNTYSNWPTGRQPVTAITFSNDGNYLYTSDTHGHLEKWNISSGERIWIDNSYTVLYTTMAITTDNKYLFQAAYGGFAVASIFSLETNEVLHYFEGIGAVLSEKGDSFFIVRSVQDSGGKSAALQEIKVSTGEVIASFPIPRIDFETTISKGGRFALIGNNQENRTELFNVKQGKVVNIFEETGIHTRPALKFFSNANKVAGVKGNRLNIYDISDLTSRVSNAEFLKN